MSEKQNKKENDNKVPLWASVLATWFGSGKSPFASGTCGSFAALPFVYLIVYFYSVHILFIASIAVFFIGWKVSQIISDKTGLHDPGLIVIDEVAGQWLTFVPALYLFPEQHMDIWVYMFAFLTFRVADILKPWPACWADSKVEGGLGVMLDDCLAAIYSGTALCLYIKFFPL